MRWFIASICAATVLLLMLPVLASGSSDGPGPCTSALGLRTLGNSENCDTFGVVVSLPVAIFVFVLIAWAWRHFRSDPS
jgi:hypothetical protein